jgi:hypothetical protein
MARTRLVQLDTCARPSLFDSGAAIDADIDHIDPIGSVSAEETPKLVQDALFSRAPGFSTAFWVGGDQHDLADAIGQAAYDCQVKPFWANVAVDPSGSNTTAAAIFSVLRETVSPADGPLLVVGGSGMVGQALVTMASWQGYRVWISAANRERLARVADALAARYQIARPTLWDPTHPVAFAAVVATGPAGVEVFRPNALASPARVLVDVNAVPPAGIRGVEPNDAGRPTEWGQAWGALAVGGRKMKLHHHLLRVLFQPPHRLYNRQAILDLALGLFGGGHESR